MLRISLTRKDALRTMVDAGFPPSIAERQIMRAVENAGDWCIKWAGNTKIGILYEYAVRDEAFRVSVEPEGVGAGIARH